ncbi:thiamine phosphate synthase [Saprospira grandis]|uniref:Thiamine-phosphate synthase n=1 Tax=Saprospira grandis (strain Lewin) TaxID=984262 RepID=H6L7W8_SAPGL|nr:thiamine phosphate synthase [Saprospira grandis]AFC24189.1 thiamine-phosphate diphosphorylase [Saprospira grandis str. Lewin]
MSKKEIAALQYVSSGQRIQEHLDQIADFLAAGGRWVQLRLKEVSTADYLAAGKTARALCDQYQAQLIINDQIEVAQAVAADGLHLGRSDMPLEEARAILGPDFILGGTANSWEDIREVYLAGADYIGLGPFRFTPTKKKLSPILGMKGYRERLQQLERKGWEIPVVGIGGIKLADIEGLLRTGLHGVALSGLINQTTDKKTLVKEIYQLLEMAPSGYK